MLQYPGLKEDVYVRRLRPDPTQLVELGAKAGDVIVTLRPPATEAHYHTRQSETLFEAAMQQLGESKDVFTVLLPRNDRQRAELQAKWDAGSALGT